MRRRRATAGRAAHSSSHHGGDGDHSHSARLSSGRRRAGSTRGSGCSWRRDSRLERDSVTDECGVACCNCKSRRNGTALANQVPSPEGSTEWHACVLARCHVGFGFAACTCDRTCMGAYGGFETILFALLPLLTVYNYFCGNVERGRQKSTSQPCSQHTRRRHATTAPRPAAPGPPPPPPHTPTGRWSGGVS